MILEEDSLLNLRYDATTDILSVTWPDLINTHLSEVENWLNKLGNSITHFYVKKLLLDLSTSEVHLDESKYQKLLLDFMASLTATRLEKMARVMANDPVREDRLLDYFSDLKNQVYLPFQVKDFSNKPQALNWLMEEPVN